MQDGETIVCVEVKYRKSRQFGQAVDLLDNNLNPASTPLRIDVIAIDGDNLQWLKNIGWIFKARDIHC